MTQEGSSQSTVAVAPAESSPGARDATALLSSTLLMGIAEKLGERFLPLFLTNLGGGADVVGSYQAATNLTGAVGALPGGRLADRLGSKRALQWIAGASVVGFLLLAVAPNWPVALVGSLLALSWSAISLPASLVLVTKAVRTKNTAWGVSMHSLIRRIPMAIGPLIAGALIMAKGEVNGLRIVFLAALALGVVSLVVQGLLIGSESVQPKAQQRGEKFFLNPLVAVRSMSGPLRELLTADILIRFCEQIPYAFVIIWCLHEMSTPVTALQFGQLTAIEMIVAMLVYLPGAWLSSRVGKPASVALTFVFFVLFPIALLLSRSFGWLVVAFVLRGCKELGEPTRKSLILDLCPPEARASYFGAYYCLRDTLAAVAALIGAAIWSASPSATLIVAAGFGAVGLIGYTVMVVTRTRSRAVMDQAVN